MKNKRTIISWILLLAWMSLIFFMSNQPSYVSSKQSSLVIDILAVIGIDLNSYFGSIASFVVRKAAHFSEYFILYFLAVNVIKNYVYINKARLYALLIVFAYASTDEIHQYFVPGRSMAFRDVLIDFSGGFSGYVIQKIYYKLKNVRKNTCISEKVVVK